MTRTELTKEAEELGLHDLELYEYDSQAPEGQRVSRVSAGEEDAPARDGGADVSQLVAVSADGSVVYFNAGGKLTEHAPGGGLYRYEATTDRTAYVAPDPGYPAPQERVEGGRRTLGIQAETWYARVMAPPGGGPEVPYAGLDLEAPYYTTGDGDFLVFASTGNVTGYDSVGKEELYRYTYQPGSPSGGSVVCVSCDPTGAPPAYSAQFTRSAVYTNNPAGTPPRPISEDGDYVFFDSRRIVGGGCDQRPGRRV